MTFGYWIPIWISRYWPLVVGGKRIATWIPYTIISFELMVLIGGLVDGGRAVHRGPAAQDHRRPWGTTRGSACDDYGVWVECTPDRAQEVETALRRAGAVEVRSESEPVPSGRCARRARTVVALGATVVGASACSWFTAFVEQPKVDPWEAVSFPTNTLQPSRGQPAVLGADQRHVRRGLSGLVLAAAGHDRLDVRPQEPDAAPRLRRWRTGASLSDQLHSVSRDGGEGRRSGRQVWAAGAEPARARGQGSQRRLHLGDDPQRTWCNADV